MKYRNNLFLMLFCFLAVGMNAHGFGKNKITRKNHKWLVHKTEHFSIHYYRTEAKLVSKCAELAEEAYDRHSEDFSHEIAYKIPVILYQSHADFRDTNIILDELSEGVSGFAELFKRRIVIPFTASPENFREVIFHELVHIFQYDIIYHKPISRIYSGEFLHSAAQWFIEGSADYFAEELDPIGEMVLRDAVLDKRIIPLQHLETFAILGSEAYLGYKIGQSAIGYIVEKYGRDSIGELMFELRQSRTKKIDKALREVVGISIEELDKEWQMSLKKKYWPLVDQYQFPDGIAKNLTKKSHLSSCLKPSWSPGGELIAYVAGDDGFSEIFIMAENENRSAALPIFRVSKKFFRSKYEEIRIEGSAIAWSPDGDRISFIAYFLDKTYLMELNIVSGKLENRIRLDFDFVRAPSYHPTDRIILFSALRNNQTDLFKLDLATQKIEALTDDLFDDNYPQRHPIRNELIFSSERNGKKRLILLDLEKDTDRILTDGHYNAIAPKWSSNGDRLIFSGDIDGVYDLYSIGHDGENLTRLTKLLTGAIDASFSPNGKTILFSGYQNGRQDIFTMPTASTLNEKIDRVQADKIPSIASAENEAHIAQRKYKPKLGIDAISANFTLGSDGLLRNNTQMIASDMMGNHRLGLSVVNQTSELAPDFMVNYGYFARRLDFGVTAFNYHEYHLLSSVRDRRGVLQRISGISGYATYPINRYHRIDFHASIYSTPFNYNFKVNNTKNDRGLLVSTSLAFVSDTTMWREIAPYTGSRFILSIEKASPVVGSDLDLTDIFFDFRKYFRLGKRSNFAMRLLLGGSFGKDSSYFYLGGLDTLRAYRYEELIGTRIGLLNFELRIPFIDELNFGFPFSWSIVGLRAVLFADFGTAWSEEQFNDKNPYQLFSDDDRLKDLKGSIGFGTRLQLGFFSLDFDVARKTDLRQLDDETVYHFGLGQAF